jgi:hypothetical protein
VILSELIHRYRFSRVNDEPILYDPSFQLISRVRRRHSLVSYDPSFQLIRPMNLFVRAQKRTEWPQKSEKI